MPPPGLSAWPCDGSSSLGFGFGVFGKASRVRIGIGRVRSERFCGWMCNRRVGYPFEYLRRPDDHNRYENDQV